MIQQKVQEMLFLVITSFPEFLLHSFEILFTKLKTNYQIPRANPNLRSRLVSAHHVVDLMDSEYYRYI